LYRKLKSTFETEEEKEAFLDGVCLECGGPFLEFDLLALVKRFDDFLEDKRCKRLWRKRIIETTRINRSSRVSAFDIWNGQSMSTCSSSASESESSSSSNSATGADDDLSEEESMVSSPFAYIYMLIAYLAVYRKQHLMNSQTRVPWMSLVMQIEWEKIDSCAEYDLLIDLLYMCVCYII
jgi:hypothetical protein